MNPGELRHRITFQKLTTSTNENGFEVEEWLDIKTLWAKVSNLHGREYFEAAAIQMENTLKFTIRYLKDIDTSMRIIFKERHYDIKSIDNIRYENKYMEIKAMEVEKSG